MIKMYPEKYGANNLANIFRTRRYSERLKQNNARCMYIITLEKNYMVILSTAALALVCFCNFSLPCLL